MNYLLDTNVVSEWARPRPAPQVVRWLADADEDRVFLSVITIAELERGVSLLPTGKKRESLASWIANDLLERFEGRLLDVTVEVARAWGVVMSAAQRAGRPLAAMDGFFAATSRAHGLALVTRNDADFASTGVEIVNPWKL